MTTQILCVIQNCQRSQIPSLRFICQSHVIAQAANLERQRLLQWTLAYAGLSASWFLEEDDHQNADLDLFIAELALQALSMGANNHEGIY
ncbi:aminoglycoside phosphotransferase family protein [Nitrosomonas communis]|uniref:aminoglycoside phosphotransferase family protein n=1 Tax=Nitrosomonas communis TaxID=44574 RepID=UPI00370995A8